MEERGKGSMFKDHVIDVYQDLEGLVKSDEFEEDIRKELQQMHPKYVEILEKRKKDIRKTDHGIVIAGETSSGKSTLINKILGKNIFRGRNVESTGTVCKLRNCDKIRIIVEHISGEMETTDLSNECNLETKQGRKLMRNKLKELTDMTKSSKSKDFRCVDIGFHIPFLKGNTILVDTPGIGGSGTVSEKLMEYLPNAVSFIFVINVGSAGGMQNDRLPVILKSLLSLMAENEMPCFDPKDVIFITNKWDTIPKTVHDSSDSSEDEETRTWDDLYSTIKQQWPDTKDENIFKLNLKDVLPDGSNPSTKEFIEFENVLQANATKAENIRVVQHANFLQQIFHDIENMVNERCKWYEMNAEEKLALVKRKEEKLSAIKRKCEEVHDSLKKMTKDLEEETATSTRQYMETDSGKLAILNPPHRVPISKFKYWKEETFTSEINSRLNIYVAKVMHADTFVTKNKDIQEKTISFYKEICKELDDDEEVDLKYEKETSAEVTSEMESSAHILLPFIMYVGYFSLPVGILLGGVYLFFHWQKEARRNEVIDRAYDQCKKEVPPRLEKECCFLLRKIITKVMLDLLPRRLNAFEERLRQLREMHEDDLSKQNLLSKLNIKVTSLKQKAVKLKASVN